MANRIVFEGLDEFKAMLQALAGTLTQDADAIVDHFAEITASSVRQVYPLKEGRLRRGVKVQTIRGKYIAGRAVRSTSPEAHLWEFGTQNRVTRRGWNRGRAPAHKPEGLVSIAIRNRRLMLAQLIALVQRRPFEVTNAGV
jgi:hypothetical protein